MGGQSTGWGGPIYFQLAKSSFDFQLRAGEWGLGRARAGAGWGDAPEYGAGQYIFDATSRPNGGRVRQAQELGGGIPYCLGLAINKAKIYIPTHY